MKLRIPGQTNYRALGNRYRDARRWAEAASAYRRHLQRRPGDAAIQIQLGHALKEQGQLAAAVDLYRLGAEHPDHRADAFLHLADALERLGRIEEALPIYYRLHAMTDDATTWRRIVQLRRQPGMAPVARLGEGALLLPLDDLFGYLRAHDTMSGIQRVQAGIAEQAMLAKGLDVHFVLERGLETNPVLGAGEFWHLDAGALAKVLAYASGAEVDHATLKAMLNECEGEATRVVPVRGATIVILGGFWAQGMTLEPFFHAHRAGVRVGALIHDLIPISHPEFCDAQLVIDFTTSVAELCSFADFLLTVSDATGSIVTDFLRRHDARDIPVRTVANAHVMAGVRPHTAWPPALAAVEGRPFALYVSTIEGRKNHLYVANAWRRLIAEGVKVPDLVFIGREGWRVGALQDVLQATEMLGGRLHMAHGLTDGELATVYDACQFTLFTSFVEGWGLPIGESLVHGRPCIASGTSSMPEVGGAFADYVDPYDIADGVTVIRRMITDKRYRAERQRAIQRDFTPRTWADVFADFTAALEQLSRVASPPATHVKLREGTVMWLPDLHARPSTFRDYFAQPTRLMIDNRTFYPVEPDGAWMKGGAGTFDLYTTAAAGDEVIVGVKLVAAAWAQTCRVQISAGPVPADGDEEPEVATMTVAASGLTGEENVRLRARVGGDGEVRLTFRVLGTYQMTHGDTRNFAIGLTALGYARADNVAARQDLLENFTFRHSLA